jgi:hypothetical protein
LFSITGNSHIAASSVPISFILKGFGFEVTITKGSGDGGIDLLLKKDQIIIIVQCKKHFTDIGPAPIRELYGVMNYKKIKFGIFVTLKSFSIGAIDFATSANILCLDSRFLISPTDTSIKEYLEGKNSSL